jgi:hypothetical protein
MWILTVASVLSDERAIHFIGIPSHETVENLGLALGLSGAIS